MQLLKGDFLQYGGRLPKIFLVFVFPENYTEVFTGGLKNFSDTLPWIEEIEIWLAIWRAFWITLKMLKTF